MNALKNVPQAIFSLSMEIPWKEGQLSVLPTQLWIPLFTQHAPRGAHPAGSPPALPLARRWAARRNNLQTPCQRGAFPRRHFPASLPQPARPCPPSPLSGSRGRGGPLPAAGTRGSPPSSRCRLCPPPRPPALHDTSRAAAAQPSTATAPRLGPPQPAPWGAPPAGRQQPPWRRRPQRFEGSSPGRPGERKGAALGLA